MARIAREQSRVYGIRCSHQYLDGEFECSLQTKKVYSQISLCIVLPMNMV